MPTRDQIAEKRSSKSGGGGVKTRHRNMCDE